MIDDNFIYINNFRKTIKVPIEEIKNINENIMISPRPVFIEFKNETEFGHKIMFIAYTEVFLLFSSHPVIKEIHFRMHNKQERNQ